MAQVGKLVFGRANVATARRAPGPVAFASPVSHISSQFSLIQPVVCLRQILDEFIHMTKASKFD